MFCSKLVVIVFDFSEIDSINRLALSQDLKKTEFVSGVLLKLFYSFGNFHKMFWAGVSFCRNFVDSYC